MQGILTHQNERSNHTINN